MSPAPSLTFADVAFTWPDGSRALDGITGSFSRGRTGLVGVNGAGKSTLLRLAAGELQPTSGRVTAAGDVGYLAQTLPLERTRTVAELLGVDDKLRALRAIEAGSVDERDYELLGDDWDLETRSDDALREIGLPAGALDRSVGTLSGGEGMLVAIAGLRLRRTPITLLDEPTNNLDRDARRRLAELVDRWGGALVVVSHDTGLLEHMDDTAELYAGGLSVFGGPYSAWRMHLHEEQAAAAQAVRAAEQQVRVERRQRVEAETKIARRARAGEKLRENRSAPKIVLGAWERAAQVSAGKTRGMLDDRIRSARAGLDAAEERLRDEEHILLDLPDPGVARGRRLAEFDGAERSFVLQGPERVAVIGANGA
ncbi:MAG TPA: ATP-binding cassette domain-containing protein, partial [Naasia sp.]